MEIVMPRKRSFPNPRLYKTIFEVRYPPKLEFFNVFIAAAQAFDGYPNWEVSSLAVSLRNFEKRCSLNIQHNRFAYDQDSDDPSVTDKYIKEALGKLPNAVKISSCVRFVFRRKYLIAVKMSFEELVKVLDLKFLSQDTRLKKILPHKTDDVAYIVNVADEVFKYHIRIGPLQKIETARHMEFSTENHLNPSSRAKYYSKIVDAYPDVSIIFDLDIYREEEDIPIKEASTFVEEAQNRIEGMVKNFRNYIFDITLEDNSDS
jgi:hypothetical protein